MCKTIESNYGEKIEWWMDEAKEWADAAKKAKAEGKPWPYLKNILVPNKRWDKMNEEHEVMGQKKIDVIKMFGFMKHAIVFTFYYLQMSTEMELNYKDCIREIVSLSGDTDTNACIAGAAIGALLGYNKIDEGMVNKVLECDVTVEGQKRPSWLSVGQHGIKNIAKLIELRAGDSYTFVNHPDK